MPDSPINITIEELHVHIDELPEGILHDKPIAQTLAANSVESTEHLRGSRGAYDIKDRPIRGLILEQLESSDGITVAGLAELTQSKRSTVSSDLYRLRSDYNAVKKLEQSDGVYYKLTETGRRLLDKYRYQWRQGRRNLPDGFLEGFRTEEP